MGQLFFQPEGAWVGDLIPYYEDGIYYAFYLHDPRRKEKEYAEDTTWHLATTRDFRSMQYEGEAIAAGGCDRPNKNIYTGSVVKDKSGRYHAFYTAYNADIRIDGKSVQSVMQAVGKDLHSLKTDEAFRFVADGRRYEEFDWRDPFVFYHEGEGCYWMLLAARAKGGGKLRGGCIALCKSEDLYHWSYEEPFYSPRMYITMECPEVFRMGRYWYLVFSTFSDRFVTHYRIAEGPEGPWRIPEDDAFDSRADYAIKTASDGKRRFAFGWIASREGNCDFGPWDWGGTMVCHEITQNGETGELSLRATEGTSRYYETEFSAEGVTYYNCDGSGWGDKCGCSREAAEESEGREENRLPLEIASRTLGAALYDVPEDCFSLEMTFSVKEAREFGVALHTDEGLEKGYFLRMDPQTGMMAWDIWPRTEPGFYQWQIDGDVPCRIETARKLPEAPDGRYEVELYREGSICLLYVNRKKALSFRLYDHKGGKAGLYLVQGKAVLESLQMKTKA